MIEFSPDGETVTEKKNGGAPAEGRGERDVVLLSL